MGISVKHKSNVYAVFKSFHTMIMTQFDAKIRILRSDNEGEFISGNMTSYLDESSIAHQITCPGTPEQNGVA